ncbi:hypothetical protein [Dactylococcopsis salina]|uniref:Uncharacterized protein n=1 Tax=Dactylococcopsis salina (strain PCC 8305) TaxID=13035 RepID=K9YZU8_DACS8|nr:hypothetical protein Dacsa_3323 [Dactylococcopsis salina PCC 8305]
MLDYSLLQNLPSAEDLPDSDDTPVDNELQELIPHLLRTILRFLTPEERSQRYAQRLRELGIDPNSL